MGTQPDFIRQKYGPLKDKNLRQALAHRIAEQFPRIGGPRIQGVCADVILEVIEDHLRPCEHLRHGQALWMAVHRDSPPKQRQKLLDTRMVPVLLTLSEPADIDRRIERVPVEQRLLEKARRLCQQAYEQGGLLSNCDLSELLGVHDTRISQVLTQYERKHQTIVPRRANLHDVGSGVTHKRIICWKRYAEGKEAEQVARETYHSLEAVDRYLGQYDRVRHCRLQGMSAAQTAEILNCSLFLVREYLAIDQELQDRTSSSPQASGAKASGAKASGAKASAPEPASHSLPWLDFEEIRNQITMEKLLKHLNLWSSFKQSRGDHSQWRGPCPFHEAPSESRRSKKSSPPFSINTKENLFHCFEKSCGASGNVIGFWRLVKGLTWPEAGWDLVRTFGLTMPEGPQGPRSEMNASPDP